MPAPPPQDSSVSASDASTPPLLEERYTHFKQHASSLFTALHELAATAGEPKAKEAAKDLVASINDPFLFVVVGEVKAGKSSFINALLQEDVCEVAPDPCTDVIQKIVHRETPKTTPISQNVREIGHPAEILKNIAIVDTPGANTLLSHHQEITEGFIPRADLVIFVFPAINPYLKTAWEFFDFVHTDWRKKIVFVLQQADRATPRELEVNTDQVRALAGERGVTDPRIFIVSAHLSRTDPEAGGMEAIWRTIRETVTGGRHYALKMRSLLETARHALELVQKEVDKQAKALEHDKAEENLTTEVLAMGRKAAATDVEAMVRKCLAAYDREAQAAVNEFEEGLNLVNLVSNSVKAVTGKRDSMKQWMAGIHDRFEGRLAREMERITETSGRELAKDMGRMVDQLLGQLERAADKLPASLRNQERVAARTAVARQVSENIAQIRERQAEAHALSPEELRKLGDRSVVGGFIGAAGAVLAASAKAAVFDITGGVVAATGALIALNAIVLKRRGAIRAFRADFDQGRERLERELHERLQRDMDDIFQDLQRAFAPLFHHVAAQEERLQQLREDTAVMRRRLDDEFVALEEDARPASS